MHVGMITIPLHDRSKHTNMEKNLKKFDSNRTLSLRLNTFSAGKPIEEQPSLNMLEIA
jgi:hypothetical protein